jgi:effector-binding domain-containing protein
MNPQELRFIEMRTLFLLLTLTATIPMAAYESAFPKTEVGVIEIKELPPGKVIVARSEVAYFERADNLFRPLFNYIKDNKIAMTVPVEAEIDPGAMYFYLGTEAAARDLQASEGVEVETLPARAVASIGIRGGYGEANFLKAKAKLEAWLAKRPEYKTTGAARAIYWNGPLTLPALKRGEIHIPIAPTT